MARIFVSIDSLDESENVIRTLTEAGHEILLPEDAGTGPEGDLAGVLIDSGPAAAVLTYSAEDAASVKVMQDVLSRDPLVKFIFVLENDPGLEHLVMAMNEGASAVLTAPVASRSLTNYLNRALTARKEEKTRAEEIENCHRLIDHEKACTLEQTTELSSQKRLLTLSYNLINHLLATAGPGPGRSKVLLVSDSVYQVDIFRQHLEARNFEVLAARDGQEGLETARRERPRIVVSDLEMPGLNGLELCQAIKNDPSLAPNHFIICTANQDRIAEVMKPEHKVDDCLLKPSHPEDFSEFTARTALGLII